jgi:integrase
MEERTPLAIQVKHTFQKVRNARGHVVRGLWVRNKMFYAQIRMGGSSAQKIPLGRITVPQALMQLNALKARRAEGERISPTAIPKLKEYVDNYLESIVGDKRESTVEKEAACLKRWVEHMGELRLHHITPLHVDTFLQTRKADVGGRTRDIDVLILRNVLKRAMRHGFIKFLATAHHQSLAEPAPKRPLWPVSAIQAVCNAAIEHCKNGRQMVDYLLLMTFCGARREEALRLKKSDIDWDNSRLTIGSDGLTKNRLVRHVDFNPQLEAHLRDMARREDPHSKWLFPSPKRGRADVSVKSFREAFESAKTIAGKPDMQFHDMRHFFASVSLMAGVDIQTVADWLGHQDKGITLSKTYSHLLDAHKKEMAAKVLLMPGLENLIGFPQKQLTLL